MTYAQQVIILRRLRELGHGEALKAWRKGTHNRGGDYSSTMRYGVYYLEGPAEEATEAADLFRQLGYVVYHDEANQDTSTKEHLYFQVEEPA